MSSNEKTKDNTQQTTTSPSKQSLINTDKARPVRCDSCQALWPDWPYGKGEWCPYCGNYLITVVETHELDSKAGSPT